MGRGRRPPKGSAAAPAVVGEDDVEVVVAVDIDQSGRDDGLAGDRIGEPARGGIGERPCAVVHVEPVFGLRRTERGCVGEHHVEVTVAVDVAERDGDRGGAIEREQCEGAPSVQVPGAGAGAGAGAAGPSRPTNLKQVL
ncbi:MAG: hypothetical protein AAF628_18305 [Planctomycetota bacterium]